MRLPYFALGVKSAEEGLLGSGSMIARGALDDTEEIAAIGNSLKERTLVKNTSG